MRDQEIYAGFTEGSEDGGGIYIEGKRLKNWRVSSVEEQVWGFACVRKWESGHSVGKWAFCVPEFRRDDDIQTLALGLGTPRGAEARFAGK